MRPRLDGSSPKTAASLAVLGLLSLIAGLANLMFSGWTDMSAKIFFGSSVTLAGSWVVAWIENVPTDSQGQDDSK